MAVEVGLGRGKTRNTMASTVTPTAKLPPLPQTANNTMAAAEEQIREDACETKPSALAALPQTLTAQTDTPPLHSAPAARVFFSLLMAPASTRARGTL